MVPQLDGMVLDGKYRLTRPLGEEGMGFVYVAEHMTLGRPLAVKFLRPDLAQDSTALAREPDRRFASAEQFRQALRPWLAAPDGGRHAGPIAGVAPASTPTPHMPAARPSAGAPAAAWLAFARPWETQTPSAAPAPEPRTASAEHASPFARRGAGHVPVDAGPTATTARRDLVGPTPGDAGGPTSDDAAAPIPQDAVGPPTGEAFAGTLPAVPGPDGDLGEAYAPMLGGLEAMMQAQMAMGGIDLVSLTPEQQRERQAVIEIAAELECMAMEMDVATESNSMAAATRLSLGMLGRIQAACRRHGYTWFQYVQLAAKWGGRDGFTDEVEKLVEACAAGATGTQCGRTPPPVELLEPSLPRRATVVQDARENTEPTFGVRGGIASRSRRPTLRIPPS